MKRRVKIEKPEAEKRVPLLVDRFLGRSRDRFDDIYHPKASDQIRRSLISARKFVLDEDAARRIARVVVDIPELLVREHQFARAPFDVTWVEYPCWAYWEVFREENPRLYEAQGSWGRMDTADHTVGYLIDHGRVNVIAGGTVADPMKRPHLSPLQYRLHTEWPVADQLEFSRMAGCTRIGLDAAMWGSTWDKLPMEDRKLLRQRNVMEHVPFSRNDPAFKKLTEDGGLVEVVRGAVGDLRTVIAILLILNRPSLTRYANFRPNSRGFYRSKVIPYMAHTTVKIDLDPIPVLRLVGTPAGEGVSKRRHEVRGHYCHDQTARDYSRIAGCVHEWRATHEDWTPWADAPEDEVNHWVCSMCEGKRWWRTAHMRGTAQVGFVAHDAYEVSNE